MLTILMGRAKTGKSDMVLRRIAALGESGRQILLVPEHASYQAEMDVCRACGDSASLHAEVLSFRRLSERVLSLVGGSAEVTLDSGGKLLTLQRALLETSPMLTLYRRPSQKVGFLEQMLSLFDELRSYEVSPETLARQASEISGATRDKLADLSLLYAAYESRLHRPGLDARDYMTKLCDSLEESGYVRGADIFIDGFTYFTAQERRALEIFLRQAGSVTVTLLGEPNSREEIFEPSLKTLEMLRRLAAASKSDVKIEALTAPVNSALSHLERCFFGQMQPYEGACPEIRLREAVSVYSEVEQTAAEIRRLLASGVCRCRDITVAARNMADYAGVIETVFERYEIPVYLSRRSDILEKSVLSLLTGALTAVSNGFEYEDMFRWLKTGLAGLTMDECDLLENYVLKWNLRGQSWLQEADWTENPDGYGAPWDERRVQRLAEMNRLRRHVAGLLRHLAEGIRQGKTARDYVEALYDFMEQLQLESVLTERMHQQAADGRMQEAEETAQLWEILCGVLDQFVEILGEEQLSGDEFERLFRLVLTQYSVGTIPVALDQVSVSEITRNDRHTVEYLFLLGANDHVLPDPGQSGGLLNEDDRHLLALQGIELAPTGMERMAELQTLYAALAQPTRGLTVSYPVTDVSGGELRPAFVVERLQKLFPSLRLEQETAIKDYRLTAPAPALETAGALADPALRAALCALPEAPVYFAAADRAAAARRGSLSAGAVQAVYGSRISMSASRLERMSSCHFAYFMEYGLRAKPRESAAFDAPQIGTFLHYLLENVTREVLEQGGFARVEDAALRAMTACWIDRYTAQELPNLQNRDARFRYLYARLRRLADAVVAQTAEELRHSDFVPLAFELPFGGRDGALPAVEISDPAGTLRVGGKVDRVDGWRRDGKLYLRVVDYKSGKKSFDLANVRMGLDIQMLLYLFALKKEGQPLFGGEIVPSGVLYLPARDEILTVPRSITPEQLAKEREKVLRRSGLLLDDPAVLQAMEHEALSEPHYLPLRISRDGSCSGSVASGVQLGQLEQYVDRLLHRIAREVHSGNIDADPCCRNEEDTQCQYCKWASACHFQDGRDRDRLRYILPVKAEDFWAELERGEDDTWGR